MDAQLLDQMWGNSTGKTMGKVLVTDMTLDVFFFFLMREL